ncbi:hypothetical protein Hanom_Chr11g01021721 [Helianthus anomalus]
MLLPVPLSQWQNIFVEHVAAQELTYNGLDLYTYMPELKSLDLVETKKMNHSAAGVIRLPRFEMAMAKLDANSKPILAAEDVHIISPVEELQRVERESQGGVYIFVEHVAAQDNLFWGQRYTGRTDREVYLYLINISLKVSSALAAAMITFGCVMSALVDLNKFEEDVCGEFGIA